LAAFYAKDFSPSYRAILSGRENRNEPRVQNCLLRWK